jgi:ribonuclease HI
MQKNINTIFTDGSSRGNPGRGGWSAIVATGEYVEELGGAEKNTTNNRMELMGVIKALEKLQTSSSKLQVVIHTDSSYVLNGATKWIAGWQKNNWKTKTKSEVLNKDLWVKLAKVLTNNESSNIEWKLVKGHSGVPANERCDVIATSFADGLKSKLYSNVLKNYGIDLKVIAPTKTRTNFSSKNLNGQAKHLKHKTLKSKAHSYISSVNGVVKTHATWAECEKRVKGVSGAKFKKSLSPSDEASIIGQWIKQGKRPQY